MSWGLPRFDFAVHYAAASHIGKVRDSNEDAWRVDMNLGFFGVADGMGRHAAGEVAAHLSLDTLISSLQSPEFDRACDRFAASPTLEARRGVFEVLHRATVRAHEAVLAEADRDSAKKGMGCTLDAALLVANRAFLIHVGDGRAYITRPTTTIQLTNDHTVGGSLVARGIDTPTQAGRNSTLTNAVGVKGKIQVDEIFVELGSIDRILLCSDGVYGPLRGEDELQKLVRSGGADATVYALINAALESGGKDNATAIVIDVNERHKERVVYDGGLQARDLAYASQCPLFDGLRDGQIARALAAGVEEKFAAQKTIPRFSTNDRVGYILLDGEVGTPDGWTLGPSALVYAESLAGGGRPGGELCLALREVRALRIRADDFREVCAADPDLAAALYERLARTLGARL